MKMAQKFNKIAINYWLYIYINVDIVILIVTNDLLINVLTSVKKSKYVAGYT